MKDGKILIIEGVSNCGKTTLCNLLKKRDNFKVIPEAVDFTFKCPKTAKNEEEELKNQKIFLEIEKLRLKKAIKYSKQGYNTVLDRSVVSTLAISYALDKLKRYNVYNKMLVRYNEWLDDCEISRIDKYIVLKTNDIDIYNRNVLREKQLSKNWLDEYFLKYQKEFFENYFSNTNNAFFLDTSNKTIEKVYKKLKLLI